MELIKQIKQAEAQAQEIIDRAKAEAIKEADLARQKRQQATAEAEAERKKAVASARERARAEGQKLLEGLKAQAEDARRKLRNETDKKMAAAVDKALGYLKG